MYIYVTDTYPLICGVAYGQAIRHYWSSKERAAQHVAHKIDLKNVGKIIMRCIELDTQNEIFSMAWDNSVGPTEGEEYPC